MCEHFARRSLFILNDLLFHLPFHSLRIGDHGFIKGELTHPEYRIVDKNQTFELAETLTQVYSTTEGLSQRVLRNCVEQIEDFLLQSLRRVLGYPSLSHQQFMPSCIPLLDETTGKHLKNRNEIFSKSLKK